MSSRFSSLNFQSSLSLSAASATEKMKDKILQDIFHLHILNVGTGEHIDFISPTVQHRAL